MRLPFLIALLSILLLQLCESANPGKQCMKQANQAMKVSIKSAKQNATQFKQSTKAAFKTAKVSIKTDKKAEIATAKTAKGTFQTTYCSAAGNKAKKCAKQYFAALKVRAVARAASLLGQLKARFKFTIAQIIILLKCQVSQLKVVAKCQGGNCFASSGGSSSTPYSCGTLAIGCPDLIKPVQASTPPQPSCPVSSSATSSTGAPALTSSGAPVGRKKRSADEEEHEVVGESIPSFPAWRRRSHSRRGGDAQDGSSTTRRPSNASPRAAPHVSKIGVTVAESALSSYLKANNMPEYRRKQKQRLHQKYPDLFPKVSRKKRAVGVQDQLNFYDERWVSTLTIGTPPQTFSVLIDTGSANLWLPDSTCADCKTASYALYPNARFTSSASSTYVYDGTKLFIAYGDGTDTVQGFLARDTISLPGVGGYQGITIPNTTFGQITTLDDKTAAFDGILGAAFTALSSTKSDPPLVNAIKQGILTCPIFETYFRTEGKASPDSTWSGQITFGGFDVTNCGTHTFVPLLQPKYWMFGIQSVMVGSVVVNATFSKGIMDTGAPLISGPKASVATIALAVGATLNAASGVYTVSCTATYDPVIFVIDGNQYSLGPSILTMGSNGQSNGQCLFGIEAGNFGSSLDWLVGSVFNRGFCLLHDLQNAQIGIAKPLR